MVKSTTLNIIRALFQEDKSITQQTRERVIDLLTDRPAAIKPSLLNLKDAATWCGVSRMTLYTWIRRGIIKPVVISGLKRIRVIDLELLTNSRSEGKNV
jgi:hypothetical protein